MTRNSKNEYSKNEYSKNEYSKNGYEKSEYSKNQKNSRDCNHVKDREMSSYGQQNREQDEKDEFFVLFTTISRRLSMKNTK